MRDQETIEDLNERLASQARLFKEGGRRSRRVGTQVDCKRLRTEETNPQQVSKVLGLVDRQGLPQVVETESPPIVCCKLMAMRLRLHGVAVCRGITRDQ